MLQQLISRHANCVIFWTPDFRQWREAVDNTYTTKIKDITSFGVFCGSTTIPTIECVLPVTSNDSEDSTEEPVFITINCEVSPAAINKNTLYKLKYVLFFIITINNINTNYTD